MTLVQLDLICKISLGVSNLVRKELKESQTEARGKVFSVIDYFYWRLLNVLQRFRILVLVFVQLRGGACRAIIRRASAE